MPNTPSNCATRVAMMTKGRLFGFFFLHTGGKNVLWTFDPRLEPQMYYFEYETAELAVERFNEMIAISTKNGWKTAFNGTPNNAQLS
ncbi:MAG: hypothetical protein ABL959_12510 [Pyrinomonadaceae bacterium]